MSKTKFPYLEFLTTIAVIVVILLISESYQNIPNSYIAAYGIKQDTRTVYHPKPYSQVSKLDISNTQCNKTTVSSVLASGEKEGTIAKNAIDNKPNTRWLDKGFGSYIQLDIGRPRQICSVDISWYKPEQRSYSFVISKSNNGMNFSEIFKSTSIGGTFLPERYELPDITARYLRITINGNTENDYASIWEMRINSFDDSSRISDQPSLYTQGQESLSATQNTNLFPTILDKYLQTQGPFDIILNGTELDMRDSVRYSVVNLPEHGTLSSGSTANSVRYSPTGGYMGSDSFSYMVTDGRGSSSNVTTVNIAVTNGSLNPHHNSELSYLQAVHKNMNGFIKYFDDRLSVQRSVREPIADQYIVLLKHSASSPSASAELRSLADDMRNNGAEILGTYHRAVTGYVIRTQDNSNVLDSLMHDPRVALVEQDQRVHIFSQSLPTGIDRIDGDLSSAIAGNGQGDTNADIAILDTGIDLTHPDLNVYNQKTFVANTQSANDDNGHGTHVAGIAGAKDNGFGVVGVAPGARLWAIKVLDSNGAGSMSDIIAGIDYVIEHASEIDVVNMSFGCECNSSALASAINSAVSAGVTFVAAAGNSGKDASAFSPASNPNVIAVSAIADSDGKCGSLGPSTDYGNDDSFATFSNYGPKVTIAAPGVNILSTYKDHSYASLSGTSMASPHVSGAAALYKASYPKASPLSVRSVLATQGSTLSVGCDGKGHGYFTGGHDNSHEPLLYARGL